MKYNSVLRRVGIGAGIFFIYIGLAILITWPLAANLSRVLPGGSGDTLLHYWNGWATKQALIHGASPFYTKLIFYPQGVSLVTHNMAWYQILPWLLLERFINGVTAYNLTLVLSLILCGCAAFILVLKLTSSKRGAFLAGLVYMAWPFRLSQLDHPNLLATQWIPILLFFLLCLLEHGRWRDVLFTAVSLALIGYGRWQLLIPAVTMGMVLVFWHWHRWWPRSERDRLLRLIVSGLLATLFLLPPAWMLLQEQQSDADAADVFREGEEDIMQADLLAYLTPSNGHFLLRDQTTPLYDRYYDVRFNSRRYSSYIGLAVLLLAAVAVLKKRRDSIPWLIMGLIMILLALGPLLKVNGVEYPEFPMLYHFLEPLQVFRLMRVPDRFNMFLALPTAVLAAYGILVILNAIHSKLAAWLLYLGILIAILIEYLVIPVPLYELPQPSKFFQDLAEEPGSFAVLNLPFDSLKAKDYMFKQITHQRPIIQGNLSRIPPGAYQTIESNPWLNTLRNTVEMDPTYQNVSEQLAQLAALNVRYLIMHKNLVGADRIQHWQRYLLTEPVYEDEEIIVYRTTPEIGQDFSLEKEIIPGLGLVRVMTSADCTAAGQAFEVDLGWGTSQEIDRNYNLEFGLIDPQGTQKFSKSFPLSESFPSRAWPKQALIWGYYPMAIPTSVSPGEYTLVLRLQDAQTGTIQGDEQHLQDIVVPDGACAWEPAENAQPINAIFGDRLRLLAYEVDQADQLDLRLYWRADQHMDQDYKIFVHVFDLETAVPVAQDDSMPHRNAYPTRFWGLEEIVEDRIQISLRDAAPGTYGLAVGVYDPVSGDRLEAVDREGNIAVDGRLVLPDSVDIP